MTANNKSLLPPANNQIWVPSVPPKEQKALARRHKDKPAAQEVSTVQEVKNALWLPPATPREQTVIAVPHAGLPRKRLNFPKFSMPSFNISRMLGFKDKKLWDWLTLFVQLVAALAIAASIFLGFSQLTSQQTLQQDHLAQQAFQEQVRLAQQQAQQQAIEQQTLATQTAKQQLALFQQVGSIADQGHEQLLNAYLNSMSDLMPALKKSKANSAARVVAQTKTLAIFNALKADPVRIAIIVQFLHDANLIAIPARNSPGPMIQLSSAPLTGLNFQQANLSLSSFDGVTMSGSNLSQALLTSSTFRGATLTKVNFTNANLSNVDFSGANLENANLTGATLKGANLNGADTKNAILKNIIWQ